MERIYNNDVEVCVNNKTPGIIEIIPLDDILLELVWSEEHNRLICVANNIYS